MTATKQEELPAELTAEQVEAIRDAVEAAIEAVERALAVLNGASR